MSIKTVIKIESERQLKYKSEFNIRYYISDLTELAFEFYQRILGYWGVENKVHYVRDITQGEDKYRIRTKRTLERAAVSDKRRCPPGHASDFSDAFGVRGAQSHVIQP